MTESAPKSQDWDWCRTDEYSGSISLGRPIGLIVEPISQRNLREYYHINVSGFGARVLYWGHKDDLLSAGCLPAGERRYKHFCDDGHGGVWCLQSKAGQGNRGAVRMSYYTANRAFARTLPGMLLYPEVLLQMESRPRLELVIDNTRTR